jgi:phage-related tail fiber protein
MNSIMIDRTDGLSSAAAIKGPCRVATTANIALYALQTIDGVALAVGDRVLVKNQTAGYENGIYVVDTGQWRRSKDFNKTKDVASRSMETVEMTGHGS